MTTYSRRQFDDPGDWAELHAEIPDAPTPDYPPEFCDQHGPYTPTTTGDCRACLDALDNRLAHDRRTAWQRASDHADRRDAAGDARDNDTDY